jgi:hypothetical protein
MKTVLVLAAALGLSISAAAADCVGHKQTTASVDSETKVASVVKQVPQQQTEQSAETATETE